MAHIFWEKKEIPMPENSHVNRNDGRVFVFVSEGSSVRESRRVVIGHATSETTMHPNENFKYLYPSLWNEQYGMEDDLPRVVRSGMYSLALGIGYRTGLYPLLLDSFGPLYCNMLMDYSMYSILERSDVTMCMEDRMAQEMVFSKDRHTDSWMSDFFSAMMTDGMCDGFRDAWMDKCRERGITRAWISIDGSNMVCNARGNDLAEKGHDKTGKGSDVIGFMYAVSAGDGTPITYTVYNGGKVDSKAIQKILALLLAHGIEPEGFILDRGFACAEVVDLIGKTGLPYIMMLKSDTAGNTAMFGQFGEFIRWNVACAVNEKGLFGISRYQRIFSGSNGGAYINLFYDAPNGTARAISLLSKIMKAKKAADALIGDGKEPSIPSDLSRFFIMGRGKDGMHLNLSTGSFQREVNGKGYCSIASSIDLGPQEVDRLYHLRDASETQYSIVKTQLGGSVIRVHSTQSARNRFASIFISAIMRSKIMNSCLALSYPTNRMIRELDRLEFLLLPNGSYVAIHDESIRAKTLLARYDIIPSDLDAIAGDLNQRLNGSVVSQTRMKPVHEGSSRRKAGRPRKAKPEGAGKEKRPVGRPLGSGKPKGPDKPKGTPGRPKGSKNKQKRKKGPGRPLGAKNKKKDGSKSESTIKE